MPKIAVGVAITALIVAGCSSPHSAKGASTTTTPTTTSNSTTAAAPPTTTSSATSTPGAAGGPLPAGFAVTDLTWVSPTEGWALGRAPCSHPPCTSVAHTLDGGRAWAGLPAPIAYLQSDLATSATGCSTLACVQNIRFADANTGYAFGPSSLWLTTNGGHNWEKRSTDATDALEVAHGVAVRITHPEVGCPPGCPYAIQSAPTGSTSWRSFPTPTITGYGAMLAVEGTNIYVAAVGHVAGGAEDAHTNFARSNDNGAHWVTFADPCGVTPSGREADASALSAAPGGVLAVGCTPRATGEAAFVVVSSDAGATFGPHRGGLLPTVPADGERLELIAAPTGPRLAVLVTSATTLSVAVSNDGGADWTVTHTEVSPSNRANPPYLGFQDATNGRAVLSARTVLTTTDGGGHFTAFDFP